MARMAKKLKEGPPLPPRKAMKQAKKLSKGLLYPIAPYSTMSLRQLLKWASNEWQQLGHRQRIAAPVVVLMGLLTWEKEKQRQEDRYFELEMEDTKRYATQLYSTLVHAKVKEKRRLFGR